jgi:hypothetical protein
MLDNHRQLAVSNDTHLIPRALFGSHADSDVALTPELFDQATSYRRFASLGIDLPTASQHAAQSTTFVGFASALFDEYAWARRKPFAGEKDPEYVRRLPLIHRLFPNARVVHIIRDGRDVALSTLDWVTPTRYLGRIPLWKEEPVAVCALWWQRQVSSGIEGGKSLGELYFELRYEQLVSDPEATLRQACDFLDIGFDPEMLRYHEGRTRSGTDRPSKQQWLPPTGGIRDWSKSFPIRHLKLFEALAGDQLSSLGYPLSSETEVTADIQALAERCRDSWLDLAARPDSPEAKGED